MNKTKIIPVNLGGCYSYLLSGDKGYVLVDAGMKGAAGKLIIKLKEIGAEPGDIKLILLTHNHIDHVQGLREVRELTGAKTAVHKLDSKPQPISDNETSSVMKALVKVMGSIRPRQEEEVIDGDIIIEDGMNLSEFGLDAVVHHTPGHTEGSLIIITGDGSCIVGDTLFNIFPGTYYPIIVYDRKRLAKTYEKLDMMNPGIYYPSHGKPITRDDFKKKIMGREKYFK